MRPSLDSWATSVFGGVNAVAFTGIIILSIKKASSELAFFCADLRPEVLEGNVYHQQTDAAQHNSVRQCHNDHFSV